MNDFFEKVNKTIDVITDALVDRLPSVNEVKEYKYADLTSYVKKMKAEHPNINKLTIAIDQVSEYEGKIYANNRFLIRIVMLTEDGSPIVIDSQNDDYLGTIIIAEAIDVSLNEKMSGQKKKTFKCVGGK